MMLVLLLAAAVLVAAACLLTLAHLLRSRHTAKGEVSFQGGVSADSGRPGTGSGKFEKPLYPTLVVGSGGARRSRAPRVTLQDRSTGKTVTFQVERPMVLGRGAFGSSAGGVLGIGPDSSISRQQFYLTLQNGQVFVQNISRTARGQYNGAPLSRPVPLAAGGTLSAGAAHLKIIQLV